MTVPFGEAAILDDGRRVVTPWVKPGVYIGPTFIPGPTMLSPDAAIDAHGRVWVAAKDALALGAFVMLDSVKAWWPLVRADHSPYVVYGRRLILRLAGEKVRVAFTDSGWTWVCLEVSSDGAMAQVDGGRIPTGEGGHGMRDWDAAGKARPLAPLDETLLGFPVRSVVTVGDTSIACALKPHDDNQVLIARGSRLGTLMQGGIDWTTPRISPNGKHWIGVQYVGEVTRSGEIPAVIPALQSPPPVPAPTPPPVTPPSPEPPPMSIPNHLAVIQKYRVQFDSLSGVERAWTICNAAALELAGEGAGLLAKPSGNNYRGYATDILVYRDGTAFDVLGDGEGAAKPQWGVANGSPLDPSRWRPPVAMPAPGPVPAPVPTPVPVPTPTPTPTPVPDPSTATGLTLLAALAQQQLDVLKAILIELGTTRAATVAGLADIKQAVKDGIKIHF